MAGLDFNSTHSKEVEDEKIVVYNTRIGLVLFFIYLFFYLGFMWLSAFSPERMGVIVFAGLNLAITYGFALIIAAILLAMIYMKLCRKPGQEDKK